MHRGISKKALQKLFSNERYYIDGVANKFDNSIREPLIEGEDVSIFIKIIENVLDTRIIK